MTRQIRKLPVAAREGDWTVIELELLEPPLVVEDAAAFAERAGGLNRLVRALRVSYEAE